MSSGRVVLWLILKQTLMLSHKHEADFCFLLGIIWIRQDG